MRNDPIKEIIKLAGIQGSYDNHTDNLWIPVEAELGITLPSDFKRLVGALGPGHFGTGLYLFGPYGDSSEVSLTKKKLFEFSELVGSMTQTMGVKLYPEIGGLVLVACWDRQHLFLENQGGISGQMKVIWINFDVEEICEFQMSFTQFILRLYKGEVPGENAGELRTAIWRNGNSQFFVFDKQISPGK